MKKKTVEIENEEYRTKTLVSSTNEEFVWVTMSFKKPIRVSKVRYVYDAVQDSVCSLQSSYEPKINVDYHATHVYGSELDCITILLSIDKKFARKNLYHNRKFAPKKYLGFYMSRVARRLRKKDKYFEDRFQSGMFTYEFIYQ